MPQYSYDHVHLVSPDPQKAAKFYEQAFNAKVVSASTTRVELRVEGTRILIRSPRDASQSSGDDPVKRTGLEHFGFYTDDLQAAVADLKAKGVRFLDETRVSASSGPRIAFLMAPDNVMIELVQRM